MQRFMIYVYPYLYIKTCPLHGGLKFDGVYIEYAYIYRNTLQWIYTGNKHNIIDISQHIYIYIYIYSYIHTHLYIYIYIYLHILPIFHLGWDFLMYTLGLFRTILTSDLETLFFKQKKVLRSLFKMQPQVENYQHLHTHTYIYIYTFINRCPEHSSRISKATSKHF